MKILITGAHFTPAQAVIEELMRRPEVKIVYIGRKNTLEGDQSLSVESQVLPKLGVKFIPIVTGRMQRVFSPYTIPSLLKIPWGFGQAFYLVLKEKPDVVLSFGGYVAVPVVISAWLLSIPVIIHEQTLISGLANTVSTWFADKVALSLKENNLSSHKNTILTGNPLRKDLLAESVVIDKEYRDMITGARRSKLPLVYITGGNQGSHSINEAVKDVLPQLLETAYLIHQCGDSKFNDFSGLLKIKENLKHPERYLVSKWMDSKEVGQIFKETDLIVSRAGMNTLLETCFFGKPVLIIPLPVKEQLLNARYFQKLGNAIVLWQNELSGENLFRSIKEGLEGLEKLEEKAKKAQEIVIPDAAKRVALETILLARSKI